MHHAYAVAAGMEIKAQRERQPASPIGTRVPPFQLHDGSNGAALLHGNPLDGALECLVVDDTSIVGRRAILTKQYQPAVAQRDTAITRNRAYDERAGSGELANDNTCID